MDPVIFLVDAQLKWWLCEIAERDSANRITVLRKKAELSPEAKGALDPDFVEGMEDFASYGPLFCSIDPQNPNQVALTTLNNHVTVL